jgi:hypothetical protein
MPTSAWVPEEDAMAQAFRARRAATSAPRAPSLTPSMSALNYERNQYCEFFRKVKNVPRAITRRQKAAGEDPVADTVRLCTTFLGVGGMSAVNGQPRIMQRHHPAPARRHTQLPRTPRHPGNIISKFERPSSHAASY